MRETEKYSFKCGFGINPESVMMGHKATILVRPHLMVNGRTAPLKMLKNTKITLTTYSFIDNIP